MIFKKRNDITPKEHIAQVLKDTGIANGRIRDHGETFEVLPDVDCSQDAIEGELVRVPKPIIKWWLR